MDEKDLLNRIVGELLHSGRSSLTFGERMGLKPLKPEHGILFLKDFRNILWTHLPQSVKETHRVLSFIPQEGEEGYRVLRLVKLAEE